VHEHGLSLVVGLVGNGHSCRAGGQRGLGEEGVAHAAGLGHRAGAAGAGARLAPLQRGGDAPGGGDPGDAGGLGGRLGAQPVVEVGDVEPRAAQRLRLVWRPGAQAVEQVEQAERVGAA
jgi:hypothetical protein